MIIVRAYLIAFYLGYRLAPNARHHPPPQAIAIDNNRRVGGRVHAVVRLRRPRQLPAARHWCRLIISKVTCSLTGVGDCGVKDGTAVSVPCSGVTMIGTVTIWITSP